VSRVTAIACIVLSSLAFGVVARDLGVRGRLYPLAEEDLLVVLMQQAQDEVDSGRWEQQVKQWRQKAQEQVARPVGVALPRADRTRTHYYNPSVVAPADIRDAEGRLIHAAGTQVNPLDYVSMTRSLLFIDGDDPEQVEWVRRLTEQNPDGYKVILTQGAILELSESLNQWLYFDQRQVYTRKLSISTLPARVYQEGRLLRIDELNLDQGDS